MGIKSRAGWINPRCFGYCKFKSNCKPECRGKDLFEDCRVDCMNYGFKCKDCDEAKYYKPCPHTT